MTRKVNARWEGWGAAGKDALPCPSAKAKPPQPASAARDHCGLTLLNLNPPRLIQPCNSAIQWKNLFETAL